MLPDDVADRAFDMTPHVDRRLSTSNQNHEQKVALNFE